MEIKNNFDNCSVQQTGEDRKPFYHVKINTMSNRLRDMGQKQIDHVIQQTIDALNEKKIDYILSIDDQLTITRVDE